MSSPIVHKQAAPDHDVVEVDRPERATPDVSVIIACFDSAETVAAAARSALSGAHPCGLDDPAPDVEVLVVDDASRDGSAEAAEAVARHDPRLRVIRRTGNGGPSAARNDGLAAARGVWIAMLDADDRFEPGRLSRLLALAEATEADIVADNMARFRHRDGAPLGTLLPAGARPALAEIGAADWLGRNAPLGRGPALGYLKPVIRADTLAGRGYDPRLRVGEDFLLVLDLLLAGARMTLTSEPLYRYRVRAGSLSHRLARREIDALGAATAPRLDVAAGRDRPTADAAARWRRGLDRARGWTDAVDRAKAGDRAAAAAELARAPALWPMAARFGAEATAKRLTRRAAAFDGR